MGSYSYPDRDPSPRHSWCFCRSRGAEMESSVRPATTKQKTKSTTKRGGGFQVTTDTASISYSSSTPICQYCFWIVSTTHFQHITILPYNNNTKPGVNACTTEPTSFKLDCNKTKTNLNKDVVLGGEVQFGSKSTCRNIDITGDLTPAMIAFAPLFSMKNKQPLHKTLHAVYVPEPIFIQ